MSCTKSPDKKYQSRPSPPYPANLCCGKVRKGNSGDMYLSKADKNGVCRWHKVGKVKNVRNVAKSVRKVKNVGKHWRKVPIGNDLNSKKVREIGQGPLQIGRVYTFSIKVIDLDRVGSFRGKVVDILPCHGAIYYVLKPSKASEFLFTEDWTFPDLFTRDSVFLTHYPGNRVNPYMIGDEADVSLVK